MNLTSARILIAGGETLAGAALAAEARRRRLAATTLSAAETAGWANARAIEKAIGAARPEVAIPLYEQFLSECARLGFPPEHGEFGADMLVTSENHGPVTLIVDTNDLK